MRSRNVRKEREVCCFGNGIGRDASDNNGDGRVRLNGKYQSCNVDVRLRSDTVESSSEERQRKGLIQTSGRARGSANTADRDGCLWMEDKALQT